MKDELLRQLDGDFEKKKLTQEQYNYFKAEITSKGEQLEKLNLERKSGKVDEATYMQWSESISNDFKAIGEKWRNTVDANMTKRQKDAEKKIRRPFVIGFFVIVAIIGTYVASKYFYEHRSIEGIRAPIQEDIVLEEGEEDEWFVVNGKDIGMSDYRMEVNYMAKYDIEGLVMGTKHFDEATPFDKAFPVDISLAWGELAEHRDLVDCTNGYRKLSCHYDAEKVINQTKAGRRLLDLVSNNHLSPASKEIYNKMVNIRTGNYVRIQGYLVRVRISDPDNTQPVEVVSSMSREDHMSGVFDTTNTGCEVIYVTDIEWLD